jgi:hypothetical protein
MKHKHYDMIVAWADGAEIQVKAFSHSDWEDVDMNGEEWYEHYTYRIKPESKPDVYVFLKNRYHDIKPLFVNLRGLVVG